VEEMFQWCLLCGASWTVRPKLTPIQKRLFERYVPLCERLLGRRLLLEPNPLTVPSDVEGEIFQARTGEVLVSLVTRRKRCLEKTNLVKNLKVVVRTREAAKIKNAYVMGADYEGKKKVRLRREGKELTLTIPVHGAASLVVLERTLGARRRT
jgi:hypothetical protein